MSPCSFHVLNVLRLLGREPCLPPLPLACLLIPSASLMSCVSLDEGLARRRYRYRHNRRLYAPLSLRVLIFPCPCFGREPRLLPLPLPPLLMRLFVPPRPCFPYPYSGREPRPPLPPLPLPLVRLVPSIFWEPCVPLLPLLICLLAPSASLFSRVPIPDENLARRRRRYPNTDGLHPTA